MEGKGTCSMQGKEGEREDSYLLEVIKSPSAAPAMSAASVVCCREKRKGLGARVQPSPQFRSLFSHPPFQNSGSIPNVEKLPHN